MTMTIDEAQIFLCEQHLLRKIWGLEEEYENTKGYKRIALAKEIKRLRSSYDLRRSHNKNTR